MTRSEQRALEAYPVHNVGDPTLPYGEWDLNGVSRRSFQEGYEQAEKDTIERAIDWLKDYVKYFEIYDEKGVEEFRKAMEGKK